MNDLVVFGGANSLDFSDVRFKILRIPEVSIAIEEAQEIWDANCSGNFSLHHFLSSEDTIFFNNIHLKSLALAVVQLGLYRRHRKNNPAPKFLVGNVKNDVPLLVAAGKMTLKELIVSSEASQLSRPLAPLRPVQSIELKGQCLPEYQTMEISKKDDPEVYNSKLKPEISLSQLLGQLIDSEYIQKIVHIGPGALDRALTLKDYELHDLQVSESIDIDPMLGWFWRDMKDDNVIELRA